MDVKAANLHAGDALYDDNGDVYAAHWKNAEDDTSFKKLYPGSNASRGWLTHWLKERFSVLDDKYLSLKGGTVKGVLTVTEGIRIGTAKDKKEDKKEDKTKEIQTEITTEGDISGDKWNGKLSEWLNKKYKEQSDIINKRPTLSELDNLFLTGIRLGAKSEKTGRDLKDVPGSVLTQWNALKRTSKDYKAVFRTIQIKTGRAGTWWTIGCENEK